MRRFSPPYMFSNSQVALPAGIAPVGVGEPLGYREVVTVGVESLGQIALSHEYVADFGVGNREVALPVDITRVRSCEAFRNREAVSIGCERSSEIGLGAQRVADPLV